MNAKSVRKLLIPFLVLLLATPIIGVGCQETERELPEAPSPSALSATLVPNVPLDLYVYCKQDSPTRIPAEVLDTSYDINVDSLAVWGVPEGDNDFALGMGVTLTSASDASKLYDEITLEEGIWKKLSDNTIYLVYGSGIAAESLRRAISNNDFKHYDDSECLNAAATLPSGGETKLAAITLAKPSKALTGFMTQDLDPEAVGMINMILTIANLKVIAAGLYSPHQIDIAELAEAMENHGSIADLDLGVLILVKSGLPGFLLKPAIGEFLEEAEFTETSLGELTLYRGTFDADGDDSIPVLIRIEGNYMFAALSGQESYAETLITSIRK